VVQQLKELTDEKIAVLCLDTKLKKKSLESFRSIVQVCLDENAPIPIDHRKAQNPYKSKFGEEWETHCDAVALTGRVCITEMIDHIFEETAKAYTDCDDWWVNHDALSFMTGKTSVQYMKDKGYYPHWLLPELGVMKDDPDVKPWISKPCGNSPEVMPLDNRLNQDLHQQTTNHIVLTQCLDDGDEIKFSMKSPVIGLKTYERIWEYVPSSSRIIEDVDGCFVSMRRIVEAKGVLIDGIPRSGNRFSAAGGHGGKREEKVKEMKWTHPDCVGSIKKIADDAVAKLEI